MSVDKLRHVSRDLEYYSVQVEMLPSTRQQGPTPNWTVKCGISSLHICQESVLRLNNNALNINSGNENVKPSKHRFRQNMHKNSIYNRNRKTTTISILYCIPTAANSCAPTVTHHQGPATHKICMCKMLASSICQARHNRYVASVYTSR